MLKKPHLPPIKILKLYALLRRIIPNHPLKKEIETELRKLEAGYKGELSLDYHLSFLPDKPYIILHDIRLSYKTFYFQIDTLILHTNFILILEVKNIAGELFIDTEFNQMIRTKNDITDVFPDPILQAYKQKVELGNWFSSKKLTQIPIEYRVVLTNSNTLIKNSQANPVVVKQLIRSSRLTFEIDKLKDRHKTQMVTEKQLIKIANQLIKSHVPQDVDVLSLFQLSKSDVLPGVYCKNCEALKMERISGTWKCSRCLAENKGAHIDALIDFSLLVSPTITNREMRHFMNLPSISTATRLLSQLNLPTTGTTKNRRYSLSPLITKLN
ncbi:NERD domain-containing protein [Rossellomorea oryzaecorticis]|uniref:NERD domain-containing protein n=1 Tax=Rossellomorea oryzaecorticis TaxID=1396505 RepID=A0ABU9KCC9_9BACI